MPTLRQLAYFVHVIDEGTFTDAALELGITQPGLSHQLKALEVDLGGPLLTRTPRGPLLTPLGRSVLPHARAALADAGRVVEAAEQASGVSAGSLEVATINSISLGVLPGVLAAWRERAPGVAVGLREHSDVLDLLAAMEAGQSDLAVTPLPADWRGPRRLVGVEEFFVVLPPGHRLGHRRRLSLHDLAEEAWVHFGSTHGLAGVLDSAAAAQGFTPRVALRTDQTAAATQYAAAGVGPCLVPSNIVPPAQTRSAVRPDPPVAREVFLVEREPGDALAAAFAETVLAAAELTPPHLA